uniref:PiggyBac transposable element-derived protein domain-containing protein n=1 Tax=Clastoptera arizonana TaxID=38151 RepID=A0A1B6C4A1_9HEMI
MYNYKRKSPYDKKPSGNLPKNAYSEDDKKDDNSPNTLETSIKIEDTDFLTYTEENGLPKEKSPYTSTFIKPEITQCKTDTERMHIEDKMEFLEMPVDVNIYESTNTEWIKTEDPLGAMETPIKEECGTNLEWPPYKEPECIWQIIEKFKQEEFDETENDYGDDLDDLDYEPQEIETVYHNSESEEDMDQVNEDDHMSFDNEGGVGSVFNDFSFYIGKDGATIWANDGVAKDIKTKSEDSIKILSGPKNNACRCTTELECFFQIFTSTIIDIIVDCTNVYIQMKRNMRPDSRDRDWRPTNRAEILAYLGALYLMSVKWGNRTNLSEFFTSDGTGLTILRANFSETRFRFLGRSIRFDNINTRTQRIETDKLAPIRELLTVFVRNCQNSYTLGKFVTVDEMLVPFKGRCSFVQYMPEKPTRYGLKIYALCDATTFYTYNLEIYCKKQTTGPYVVSNRPSDVVLRLTDAIKMSNRNVTTDKYFSSCSLADRLLSNGLTFLGAMKKNQREIPPQFVVSNDKLMPGLWVFGAQYDKTLVSMATKDKKVMIVLSTMHDSNICDKDTKIPTQIIDYNATKGAVDTIDQTCARTSTSRTTRRWPVVIFYRLLDIAGINSFMIFKANKPKSKVNRRTFVFNLSLALMEENLKYRATLLNLPGELQLFLKKYKAPCTEVVEPIEAGKKKRCLLCGSKKNNKTSSTCHKCKQHTCKKHSHKVITCHPCFYLEQMGNKNIDG